MGNNLQFSDHISDICKTANQKLCALFRVTVKYELRQMYPVD